jgi:hypothetical protein
MAALEGAGVGSNGIIKCEFLSENAHRTGKVGMKDAFEFKLGLKRCPCQRLQWCVTSSVW